MVDNVRKRIRFNKPERQGRYRRRRIGPGDNRMVPVPGYDGFEEYRRNVRQSAGRRMRVQRIGNIRKRRSQVQLAGRPA